MDAKRENDSTSEKKRTSVERKSDRELIVRRTFNAPVRIVFEAWTKPELLKRWWAPKSFGITFVSCEADARTGGTYRFVFAHPSKEQPMAFYGRYLEVTPNSRLVMTSDESGEDGPLTTITFEDRGDETLVVFHDLYPSKQALDEAIASGSTSGFPEQFEELDRVLVSPGASAGPS